MKRTKILFLLLFSSLLLAQENKNSDSEYLDENVFDFIYKFHSIVEINYGFGKTQNENIYLTFENIKNWDIKLGRSEQKNYISSLIELNEKYIFGSYLSSSNKKFSENNSKINTKTYHFGFGSRNGIGFGGLILSVIPYISQDFAWTNLSDYSDNIHSEPLDLSKNNLSILNDYLNSIRFGDKSSYGVKINLTSTFQLNVNYETSVVYRRYLFWYWSGSILLSQTGYQLLSNFTDEMINKSPIVGTIFNFALKVGYQYEYYLLRKRNMNWPFNSKGNKTPLTYETFNFGLSFVF